jgi:CRP-like cAMP-binding protein
MVIPIEEGNLNNFVEGAFLTIQELHFNYGLPRKEIVAFQNDIFIYPYRSVIIKEGEKGTEIYLLRSGKVGIFKQMGSKSEQIGEIDAVNFFGEMSLINTEPRNATVMALTKNVVVYKISQPNLHVILNNPKWAEILLTRLCKNLAHNNEQLAAVSSQLGDMQAEVTHLKEQIENQRDGYQKESKRTLLALDAILYFQNMVKNIAVVDSMGWTYLNALTRISQALIEHYIPQADVSPRNAEINVIRKCFSVIRRGEKDQTFDDLDSSI